VEGSIISKRSQGLYPSSFFRHSEEAETPDFEPTEITEEVLRELRDAAKQGRHFSNRKSEGDSQHNDWEDPDLYHNW
jgi:hypothetical protein